jgi:hypothetical protein
MQQEVALQMAAMLLQEQYDYTFSVFNQHLLDLEDLYFDGLHQQWSLFDLSCALGAPLVPLGSEQKNSLEEKMENLLHRFEERSGEELKRLQQDADDAKIQFSVLLAKAEAQAKQDSQRRQDEVFAVSTLCRREVSSTVALLKSEYSHAHSNAQSLESLQRALDRTMKELDSTRARYDAVTQEQAETISKLREELQKARESARQTVSVERDEVSDRIRSVLVQADNERNRHLAELAQLHSNHASALEKLRSQLEERTVELELSRQEVDRLREKELLEQKNNSAERLELKKRVTELEMENERIRRVLVTHSQSHQFEKEALEFDMNQRKMREVEDFKKKLVYGGGVVAAGAGNGIAAASSGTPRDGFSGRRSSSLNQNSAASYNRAGSPNADVGLLDNVNLNGPSPMSPRAMYRAPSTSTTPRGSSVNGREASPSVLASLRSPSDTYLRLQNISSSWKDRLAQS